MDELHKNLLSEIFVVSLQELQVNPTKYGSSKNLLVTLQLNIKKYTLAPWLNKKKKERYQ